MARAVLPVEGQGSDPLRACSRPVLSPRRLLLKAPSSRA